MMRSVLLAAAAALALAPALASAQSSVTPPDAFFPQKVGSDYYLANYSEYTAYLQKLATQSDRMKLVDIGKTSQGRSQWVAIVSSPANLAHLEEYRQIARRLAQAKDVSEDQAREMAGKGKAIVWIDAGMHATETTTSQGQIQVLYRMLTQSDAETLRMLEDCIILFAHDNPDGMEMVSNWYMRHSDPRKREFATLPQLYQKYVGHDNNRDSYRVAMKETSNINWALFREWFPQIIYNQHQTGPDGMVVFVPPFRDPFNFNYDPLVMAELNEVGFSMHSRLVAEGKAGSGARSAARYSTWHNGMERSVAYFHNSVGLLTEIIGGPTPTKISLVPSTQLPRGDELMPIAPRDWHLQDSLDYQWTLNRAVLDYASRNKERLLFNIWRMGANSIERGSRDSWTITPSKVERLANAAPAKPEGGDEYNRPVGSGPKRVDPALYQSLLHPMVERDPRAYVIPANQADLPTAVVFLNALIRNGVEVERARAPFVAGGKTYPAGSFLLRTGQAYRAHILDMFEPQDHPQDTEYPGGPPKAPYDVAGYTLAYQMGLRFDRVLDAPPPVDPQLFQTVNTPMTPPSGRITGRGSAGWIVGHEANNSFTLTNRLLKAGVQPAWIAKPVRSHGQVFQPGAIWIPSSAAARIIVKRAVAELGLDAHAMAARPSQPLTPLRRVRIGLVDHYGGLLSAGWTSWMLEQFEFPYQTVYPKRLDEGKLDRDFDVLLFVDGALPAKGAWGNARPSRQPEAADTPPEWRSTLGRVTDEKTMPAIKAFAQHGGSIIAIGSSTRFVESLSTPLRPALVRYVDGQGKMLEGKEFYIPGSILNIKVDPAQPLAYGLPTKVDVFFNQSQTFVHDAAAKAVTDVAWFEGRASLRSGWAVGQEKLAGTLAIAQVPVGSGRLTVMAPEVVERAQSYGSAKFLYNALLQPR